MSTKIFQKSIICLLMFIALSKIGYNQSMGRFTLEVPKKIKVLAPENTLINFENLGGYYGTNNFYVKKGGLYIKLYLENAYYGIDPTNLYNLAVSFNLVFQGSQGNETVGYTLNISNAKPVQMQFVDFAKFISNNGQGFSSTGTGFKYNSVSIQDVELKTGSVGSQEIKDKLHLSVNYDFDMAIKVDENTKISSFSEPVVSNKTVQFTWQSHQDNVLPNYEFQLIKLYNTSDAQTYKEDETKIYVTKFDWNDAMKLELESNNCTLSLTMGEGSGYYAWRVRPVGTLEGGFANYINWGGWHANFLSDERENFEISSGNIPTGVFYYDDVDKNINYIYSRVITENNKISENITYATVLNQVKQKQVYNQSEDKSIVQQIILDRNGRPAIQTLPIPLARQNRLSGYVQSLVKNSSDLLYTSDDFDTDLFFYSTPSINGDIADYYSDYSRDKTIPNSDNYPFSRTIYSNDNTGNVVEVSGVGKRHMIGEQDQDKGRTTKTTYETASDGELTRLFGDEAPASNMVQKITTTDPNNISTTSYVTLDGRTIATSITYNDLKNPYDDANFTNVNSEKEVVGDVTNNIKIGESFISTKKINFFKPTDLTEFKYKISEIEISTLCALVKLTCSYNLDITITKSNPKTPADYFRAHIETIKVPGGIEPINGEYIITIPGFFDDAGAPISLNDLEGEYIIEKKLTPDPSGENSASLEDPTNGVNLPLENISDWIKQLGEIQCDQELFNFYNDYYKIAYYLNRYTASSPLEPQGVAGGSPSNNFQPSDRASLWFRTIFTQEFDRNYKKFVDSNHEHPYQIIIKNSSEDPITPTNYPPEIVAPAVIPYSTQLISRCCTLNVSLYYVPDYKCPSPADLIAIRNFVDANSATNSNLPHLFTPDADYIKHMTSGKDLVSSEFPPEIFETLKKIPDFEGYAISLINNAIPDDDELFAQKILYDGLANVVNYPLMMGWNKREAGGIGPLTGLFNMMVFKMLTDYYYAGPLGTSDQIIYPTLPVPGTYDPPAGNEDPCAKNPSDDKVPYTNYNCSEIAKCWKNIVRQIILQYCGDGTSFTATDGNNNVSEDVDDNEGGDESVHDNHFDDQDYPNWFLKLWVTMTLSKKMRDEVSDPGEETINRDYGQSKHAVFQFLECTGYQFADVLTYDYGTTPTNSIIADNAINRYSNSIYSNNYPYYIIINGNPYRYVYLRKDFTVDPNGNSDFIQYDRERCVINSQPPIYFPDFPLGTGGLMKDRFPKIWDPVYAFKYFEWESADQTLDQFNCNNPPLKPLYCEKNEKIKNFEYATCFNDPNICGYDANGDIIPCCGWLDQPNKIYKPCNFCDRGYYTCKYIHLNWSNGQRFTFYNETKDFSLKDVTAQGTTTPCWTGSIADMEKETFWYLPPPTTVDPPYEYTGTMRYIPYDGDNFPNVWNCETGLSGSPLTTCYNTTAMTYIELLASLQSTNCIDACDAKRSEFQKTVIDMFTDRCYVIGGCVDKEDNVVPWEDIDAIVNTLVERCKTQCPITTYKCLNENCRNWGTRSTYNYLNNFGNNGNAITLKFGVGGSADDICPAGTPPFELNNCSGLDENVLTYYEYTLNKQAREWLPVIDVKSLCNEEGKYASSCISGQGYLYKYNPDTGTWSWQPQLPLNCSSPNTWVEKSSYEIPNDPPSGAPNINVVETPKVPIQVIKP